MIILSLYRRFESVASLLQLRKTFPVGHGLADIVALGFFAAYPLKEIKLLSGLHTLSKSVYADAL